MGQSEMIGLTISDTPAGKSKPAATTTKITRNFPAPGNVDGPTGLYDRARGIYFRSKRRRQTRPLSIF